MSSIPHTTEQHVPLIQDLGKVGILCFLCNEVAFFSTLLVAYAMYLGRSASGPTPAECLDLTLGIINTVLLVSSSFTIMLAEKSLARGNRATAALTLVATMALGVGFLVVTGIEWYGLIWDHGLTLQRNLFGTTYFTLLGCHGIHVTLGIVGMSIALGSLIAVRDVRRVAKPVELISWYWHFVDVVWLVIFVLVYVVGR